MGTTPRAVGSRISFDEVPTAVRAWVENALGSPVVEARTQAGGFSPGAAARLVGADGRRAFVKAVGSDVNPDTPDLFRHECHVLSALPVVPYRAPLRAAYDDGTWVGLLLEDVDGRHPDLDDDGDLAAVRAAVLTQSRELTPDPVRLDVPDMAATAARWHRLVERELARGEVAFPAWVRENSDVLLERLDSLGGRMPSESWVHHDIRDDNTLVRVDGTAVLLDWGMSRPGPAWVDLVMLAVHHVDASRFDHEVDGIVRTAPTGAPSGRLPDDITDFVLAAGLSLAAIADRPVQGLPAISAFRRRESARLLAGARRRLGL